MNWLKKDTDEKANLKAAAATQMKKMRAEKNENQKIRLILNVITPDNYDKKFGELIGFLFKDLKTE